MDGKNLQKQLVVLILLIFTLNLLANIFHWYYTIWFFDMFMHFWGGFWVGLLVFYLLHAEFSGRTLIWMLVWALVIGIGWEIYQFFLDQTISHRSFNAADTFSDLFFDLAGVATAAVYYSRKIIRSN